MRYRYSRWDGTQDPFGPEVDASDVLEELADDVLMGTGVESALRRLMRRGMQGRFSGLDALRRRLANMRQQEEEALDLRGPLEEIREQLEEILDRERSTLSFKAEDDARMREMFLDSLPPDAPGKVRELSEYRFMDPEAQRLFDELMEHLREQVLGAHFRNMADGLKNMTPENARALPRHARRAQPDDRATGARRGVRLRRVHGALRRSDPERPEEPGRAAGGHGPPLGGHEPAHGVAQLRSSVPSSWRSPSR